MMHKMSLFLLVWDLRFICIVVPYFDKSINHITSKYVKRNLKEKRHYFRYIGEESVLCMHGKKIYVKDVVSITLASSLFSFIFFLFTIIKRNLLSMIYFFLYITFEQYHRCHQILLCVHIDCDIKGEEVILRENT